MCSVTGSKFQHRRSLRSLLQEGLKARGITKDLYAGPTVISRRLKESVATGLKGVSVLGYV